MPVSHHSMGSLAQLVGSDLGFLHAGLHAGVGRGCGHVKACLGWLADQTAHLHDRQRLAVSGSSAGLSPQSTDM